MLVSGKPPRPSAEVTPRALPKVRGNVRTNLLFRRNSPACRSPTMPLVPPASLGPDHSTVTRACAGARQNACRWYGDLLDNVCRSPRTSAVQRRASPRRSHRCRGAARISVQEPGQDRQEQVGAPGHLHVGGAGQHGELRAGDQLLHQGAVPDRGEVAVAEHEQGRRGDGGELLARATLAYRRSTATALRGSR